MIRIKDNVDFEVLRNFGFKKGKEWADVGERCLEGSGYAYQHEWWHKFMMDKKDDSKIAYIDDDYDIPCVHISIRTEEHLRDVYIDIAVEDTYHIGGSDLDIISETIMDLTNAGLLERS